MTAPRSPADPLLTIAETAAFLGAAAALDGL